MKQEKNEGRPQSGPFDLQEVLTVLENDLEKHWGFPSGSLRQGSISYLPSNDNRAAWTANGGVVACDDEELAAKMVDAIGSHDGRDHVLLLAKLQEILENALGEVTCGLDVLLYCAGRPNPARAELSALVEMVQVEEVWPEGNELAEHIFAIRIGKVPFERHLGPTIISKESVLAKSGMASIATLNHSKLSTGKRKFHAAGAFTHSDYWNRGLGKAVVSALLEHIADEGGIAMWSHDAKNMPSNRLALCCGFKEHVLIFGWKSEK